MEDPATSVSPSLWSSLNSWFTSTVFFILLNLMIATIVFTSNLPTTTNQQQQHEQDDEHQHQQQKKNLHQISRSPSILHRIKSFNFYPQKSQHESSPDTEYHQQHPLELAASQYVFNQPLQYQHFDLDPTVSDHQTESRAQHVTSDYDFDQNTSFNFDLSVEQNNDDTKLGFDTPHEQDDEHQCEQRDDQFESLDEVYSRLKRAGHDRTKSDGSIGQKPPAKMKKSASLKVGFAHLEEEVETVEARRPATVKEKKRAEKAEKDDDVEVDSRADDFINKFKNDLKLQRIESIMRTKGMMNKGGGK
ncbi:hypothetical protein QVD17_13906 [Tagetes erecta]|uniref:DUF4408 domain-containing protein n=1 Tax=Tagetes erecta TaxID=13708 RepID=A0AAD8L170_TARER|nr:hypothetical protein QVD17_13906 [Tagetes erecta]